MSNYNYESDQIIKANWWIAIPIGMVAIMALIIIYVPPYDHELTIAVKNHDCITIKKIAENNIGYADYYTEIERAMKLENCN